MISLGTKLDEQRGFGGGFDFLRVTLALGIVAWHSFAIAREGAWLDRTWMTWIVGYAMLYIFFALSGFLIAGSALRLKLRDFLINRSLRIFPALTIEIFLSAFLLGPLFTTLSAADYFSRAGTYRYLTNIVGLMNFKLPGVFTFNPVDIVNYSLWTVPHEFMCYAIMSGLIVFGLLKKPWISPAIAASVVLVGIIATSVGINPGHQEWSSSSIISKIFYFFFTDRGSRLYVAFCLGIAAYLFRYGIPYSFALFATCVAYCVVVGSLGPAQWMSYPILSLMLGLPLAYIMAFVGVSPMPKLPIFHRGDYSYGIYLYAMPLQQVMISLFPSVRGAASQLVLAIPAIMVFAALSWHLIELPILRLRKRFSFVARLRGADDEKVSHIPLNDGKHPSERATGKV